MRKCLAIGAILALSACGGYSEADAFADIRENAQTTEVAGLADHELRALLQEICNSPIPSMDELAGQGWDTRSADEIRDSVLLMRNAVKTRCPEKAEEFAAQYE